MNMVEINGRPYFPEVGRPKWLSVCPKWVVYEICVVISLVLGQLRNVHLYWNCLEIEKANRHLSFQLFIISVCNLYFFVLFFEKEHCNLYFLLLYSLSVSLLRVGQKTQERIHTYASMKTLES